MNAFSFFSHSPSSFFIYFLLTAIFQLSYAHGDDDIHFASCAPFDCGSLVNISYPFWTDHLNRPSSYCGFGDPGYKLNCNPSQPPVVTLSSQDFQVVNLNQSRGLLTIKRVELNTCPQEILINDVFNYSDTAQKITLFYDCRSRGVQNHSFSCRRDGRDRLLPAVFLRDDGNECVGSEKVEIPVGETALDGLMNGFTALNESLLQPFDIKYYAYENSCKHCKDSGGRCGSNETLPSAFVCYCRDRPHQLQCSHGKSDFNGQRKPAIVAAGGIIQIISSIFFCVRSRRRRGKNFKSSNAPCKRPSNLSSMIDPETVSSMIDPETGYNLVGSHVFTCKELEEATNGFHFRMLLGEGGFGSVYFGKLQDGRAVAVKRLYENNDKRVKQFMNEVEILTRLRHSNLITLYGCTSGHSRELLLVYEYVPNGTVADHLHGLRAKPGALSCSTRLDIAIGTATALCYLHASDIIHRDVKTNNILLDDNFGVKVADFGLSRPFPTDVTHVSTAPQGTPGYVDPKYHTCCQVTYKSDVYSFGVVLIELISSKPAIDFRRHRELISSQPAVDITRHRDEIFLSYIAINKILNRAIHELVDPSLGFESDKKVREMITGVAAVAFQCLQNVKDMRPTMAQVLEALTAVKNKYSNKAK